MKDPNWLTIARGYIGLAEIPGKQNNPKIINMLIALGAWWREDETPWCGTFVGFCLKEAGRDVPKTFYRALDYLKYGTRLDKPAYGCIVVFKRDKGGHVGFLVGVTTAGDPIVLGGNQGNRVSIATLPKARVAGYVWPSQGGVNSYPLPARYTLPIGQAAASRGEA